MAQLTRNEELELKRRAVDIRRNILRMIRASHAGHVGGAMSIVEILTALYYRCMRVDPKNPEWPERDRFVLSAGHKCLALYAVLAEKGFFGKDVLDTYGALKSKLPGHPNMFYAPGIETNTGALGHGLSIAGGMALGLKMDGSSSKVYVIMGDGELAEGSNWEAASAASHHRLDNMLVFVDRNTLQISGRTVDVMSYEPLDRRWESFGWSVRAIDGHDLEQIVEAAESYPFEPGKPSLVIADTVKSKGISFAEDQASFHYWKAKDEEIEKAEKDIEAMAEAVEREAAAAGEVAG